MGNMSLFGILCSDLGRFLIGCNFLMKGEVLAL